VCSEIILQHPPFIGETPEARLEKPCGKEVVGIARGLP